MKACIFHEPGRISVEDAPEPRPGPGELLLRVGAAAICHSDIRVYKGLKKARAGVIPGHETAGVIVEAGEGVSQFRPGDRVAICPILACGHCPFCLQGKRNRCLSRKTLGYEEDGGLAEYMLVPRELPALGHVFPVPEGLSLETAALMEPLACVLNSLETCRVVPGSSLLVVGAGPMGLLHLMLARVMGAGPVIVSEPDAGRRDYARRFGASLVLDPGDGNVGEAVMEATGGLGADAVVVTAALPEVLEPSLELVRLQGSLSLFGGFPPESRVPLDPNIIHYRELVLTGSQNATTDQYRRALRLLPLMPEVAQLTTHRFPIEDAVKTYESRLVGEGLKSMVVLGES